MKERQMNRRGFLLSALASTLAAQTGGSTLVVEVSYAGSGINQGRKK
jgi:hypothetical protein